MEITYLENIPKLHMEITQNYHVEIKFDNNM